MNLLVVNDTSESRNTGCQATMLVFNNLLESFFPEANVRRIYLSTVCYKYDKETMRSVFPSEANGIASARGAFLKSKNPKLKQTVELVQWADVILFNGEGSFLEIQRNALYLYGVCEIAKYFNKRYYVINFTAHITKPQSKALALSAFSKAEFVSVREALSYIILKDLGVERLKLFPDIVSGIRQVLGRQIICSNVLHSRAVVLGGSSATLRIFKEEARSPWMKYFNSKYKSGYDRCVSRYRKLIKSLKRHGYEVSIPGWDKDEWLALDAGDMVDCHILSPSEYCDVLQSSALLISGRYHGCVMAASFGVPYITSTANCFKNYGSRMLYQSNFPLLTFDDFSVRELLQRVQGYFEKQQTVVESYQAHVFAISEQYDAAFAAMSGHREDLLELGLLKLSNLSVPDFSANTIP